MSEIKTYKDFQRYNPSARPDWRFRRVSYLLDQFPRIGRCSRRDDAYVIKARTFLQQWRQRRSPEQREALFWENPGLWYAYQEYENPNQSFAHMLEARVLARQDRRDIARELRTIPETIEWYEALFFDVRDHLDARDYIVRTVLVPPILRQMGYSRIAPAALDDDADLVDNNDGHVALPFLDGSLKFFAYFGGPYMVDMALHMIRSGKPMISPDDYQEWLNTVTLDNLRRRAAQTVMLAPVNKYNTMELLQGFLRVLEIEKDEDNPDRQKSKIEKHLTSFFEEIPFTAGESKAVEERPYREHLDTAAELRDSELNAIAVGQPIGEVKTFDEAPPPKVRNLQSDDLGEM